MPRCTHIQCTPVPARSAVQVLRPDRFQPLAVPCCSLCSLSVLLAPLACPRACVRSCSRDCLLPRLHAYLRPCPCSLRSPPVRGLLAPVVRAYIVASPAVLLLAVLLSLPAANFFEIVFKPSISISPSLSWVDDATLYCHMGCFVRIVML